MKPCRTCKFALPSDDPNTGWCHRLPPVRHEVEGSAASSYVPVGMSNPGCGEHRFAWWRWLFRRT